MNENQTELTITRFLNASPSTVWKAWTTPEYFAQWWIPAPIECKVIKLDLNPGGGFETQMRQPGEDWQPHLEGCFLEAVPNERLVFTTSLIEGWQPGTPWLTLTAIITLKSENGGTTYSARVLHRNAEDSKKHETMGFQKGWGRTLDQLAEVVQRLETAP